LPPCLRQTSAGAVSRSGPGGRGVREVPGGPLEPDIAKLRWCLPGRGVYLFPAFFATAIHWPARHFTRVEPRRPLLVFGHRGPLPVHLLLTVSGFGIRSPGNVRAELLLVHPGRPYRSHRAPFDTPGGRPARGTATNPAVSDPASPTGIDPPGWRPGTRIPSGRMGRIRLRAAPCTANRRKPRRTVTSFAGECLAWSSPGDVCRCSTRRTVRSRRRRRTSSAPWPVRRAGP